jgi:hypothetical protein
MPQGASKPSSYWVTLALLGRRRATERDEVSLVGDTAVLGQPAAAPRLTGSAQRFTVHEREDDSDRAVSRRLGVRVSVFVTEDSGETLECPRD